MLFVLLTGFIAMLNTFVFGGRLMALGIYPREPLLIPFAVISPFVHRSIAHWMGNSSALLTLTILSRFRSRRHLWRVTGFTWATSSLMVWLFAASGTVTAGASGIVYGFLGYALTRGLVDRDGRAIVCSLVVLALFGAALGGMFPGPHTTHISWLGHLGGFLGGIGAATLKLHRDGAGGA